MFFHLGDFPVQPNTLTKLKDGVLNKIYETAFKNYPNEACGLIVQTGKRSYDFFPCKNVAEDPENHFVMDAKDQINAEKAGKILAVWHSHVNQSNEPSDADKSGCEITKMTWLISSIMENYNPDIKGDFRISDFYVLQPSGFKMPYVGRPYLFGVFDCWTLCMDYLKNEFNVELPYIPSIHIDDWWTKDRNVLMEGAELYGLVQLPVNSPLQKGDILFMQLECSVPNHCAIYVGDNLILHHMYNRLSMHSVYGGMYQKHTTHHFRVKELVEKENE